LNLNKEEKVHSPFNYKILSYNVRVFNLWNWSPDKDRSRRIYDFIRKSNAKIVCLQEFYSKKDIGKNAKDSILTQSRLKSSHIVYTTIKGEKTSFGIATFTAFPIFNRGSVQMKAEDNYCIYSDIIIEKDTIRIYNIHLESIHLGEKDYRLIDGFNSNDTIDVKGLKNIFWKFKKSYKKRALQVNSIVDHIKTCRYPVILCGDFNDTPYSYVYGQLSSFLTDAFRISGHGIGYTYINKYPAFRIDYILHSSELKSFGFKSQKIKLSDHYPVECNFEN